MKLTKQNNFCKTINHVDLKFLFLLFFWVKLTFQNLDKKKCKDNFDMLSRYNGIFDFCN